MRSGLVLLIASMPMLLLACDGGSATSTRSSFPAYADNAFGDWTDINRDGCDTREEVLERDAEKPIDNDRDGCADDAPVIDRYTRLAIPVNVTDIDHIVSKKDAWSSGAAGWSSSMRAEFFNDQANLFATHRSINRSKGESDAAQWKVTVMRYGTDVRCEYAQNYRSTKEHYRLILTVVQDEALQEICPVGGVRK